MDFNEKAKQWDQDPDRAARAKAFAAEIRKISGNKIFENALEFGCGTGNVSIMLADRCKKMILADTSEGMLDVVREKIVNMGISNMEPFLITPANPLAKINNADIVFTLLTMHHVKDLDQVFGEFSGIMGKNSLLFIGDLITEDGSFHFRDPEFDGHKGFDTENLKGLLKKHGLETISDKIFYTIDREHNSVMKEYPLFCLAARKL